MMTRFIACNRIGKRVYFVWVSSGVCPSDLTVDFAFDDDYTMGVLCSRLHQEWARAQSSTLEDRFRYTPTSAFETFPFPPDVTGAARDLIATSCRALHALRAEICAGEDIGLTTLYNRLEEGAYQPLARLHDTLEHTVAQAYGWSVRMGSHERQAALLGLNAEIADGHRDYDPFPHDEAT